MKKELTEFKNTQLKRIVIFDKKLKIMKNLNYEVTFINGVDDEDIRVIKVIATDKEDAHRRADRILHSNEYENKNGYFSYGTLKVSLI